MGISGELINDIVKPELREEYSNSRKVEFLSTSKYHDRTLGQFKAELQGTRMIALMRKCYYAESVVINMSFCMHDQGIITYAQDKLGLSAYYDKHIIVDDGIHTEPLW